MKKTLSLKKNRGTDTNYQKQITQFFKTQPASQNVSPVKQNLLKTDVEEKLGKRKAISPLKLSGEKMKDTKENCYKKSKIDNSDSPSEKSRYFLQDVNPKDSSPLAENIKDNLNPHNNILKEQSDLEIKTILKENELTNHDLNHECYKNSGLENDNNKSPKKSPKGKSNKSRSPVKFELSPSKNGSTVKTMEFSQNSDNIFDGYDWDLDYLEDNEESLDFNVMQRCIIISIVRHPQKLELKLKNDKDKKGTCFVEGIWLNTTLQPGDIISILANKSTGSFTVNNTSGLLVLQPDHLISTTSVVAGVFCKRKAVLQERWRGIDSANTAMTLGILIHELVQKALTQKIQSVADLVNETDNIIKESIQRLYDAGLSEKEAKTTMESLYVRPVSDFMNTYMPSSTSVKNNEKNKWNGKINKVLDVEENLCCPKLGLKGKIDATLEVTIHERGNHSTIVPLELKSGRATMSAEHRGQVFLYGMMLSLLRQEDPTTAGQKGLLLYLKERVDLKEVSCGYPERRDLIMLRNELVLHLAAAPQDIDTEKLIDIEDASQVLQQSLPEPVHHHSACGKCPYLTICSLHLWHTDGPKVSESHPLAKLKADALGHLTLDHIKYFLHWTSLCRLEEKGQMAVSPLHALWTDTVEKRAKRGVCAANLKLKTVSNIGDRFLHIFIREGTNNASSINESKAKRGPQEGEYSIVSIENRPWIAAGVISVSNDNELHILLERDLSLRQNKQTLFHIDTYESYATTVQNLTNLGVLMENSDRALRLRRIIIDRETPEFAPKLPREVGRVGTKVMRYLNIEQQRAVLKAISAEQYVLLRGLPGTGKTQTISVLIQVLVALKQRVLVTAHTHSAVDTVLSRLAPSVRVMRLGAASRVCAALRPRCERELLRDCRAADQLAALYDSMEVVGVTCLGANHPMLSKITFDVCIVDEATQVLQSTVLRPLFATKRFVLVGDPEQLPPVVRSRTARRLGMEESLFHRLMQEKAVTTLRLQYRMNQPLVDVANKVAYNGSLKCANQAVAEAKLDINFEKVTAKYSEENPWLVTSCSPQVKDAALFLNLELGKDKAQEGKSLINVEEACVVMALIESLKEGNVSPGDIGIIAPYRDQVSFLRRCLTGQGVEVSTVDQFQGRDKNVIIYSCTKRNEQDCVKIQEGEILNDQRRLAVSVTRAKHKLIILGNLRALRRYLPLLRLIEACKTVAVDEQTVQNLVKKCGNFS